MSKNIHSIILLRGIPGSGKSTLARLLSEKGKYPVYSVDDFFTDSDGNYSFDHLNNHLAYQQCQDNTEKAMKTKAEMILVDNTFTLDWEIEPYFRLAEQYEYDIYVVTVENYHGSRNIHQIPDEQIEKMKAKYKVRL